MTCSQTHSALAVSALTEWPEIESLAADWNRLSEGIPFRRWEWLGTWWRHYGHDKQPFVLVVRDGSRCVGVAPFFIEPAHSLGHIIRIWGSGEVCSDHLSILAEPSSKAAVGEAFARWLADPGNQAVTAMPHVTNSWSWDLIELNGLDPACEALSSFLATLSDAGFAVHQRTTVHTWRIALPASMEEYLAALSKPCRRKVRSGLKLFDTSECQVKFSDSPAELLPIWNAFIELHQRRRNSLGEGGCFASDTFSEFLLDASRTFQQLGRLDLACVQLGEQSVATELCFRGDKTTFAYQIGISPDHLRANPGWLVNTASIRRALSLGQTGFDLCRGDEEYKGHLGAVPTACLECRLVPPKWRSQLWDAALLTRSAVKEWFKTGLSLTGIR